MQVLINQGPQFTSEVNSIAPGTALVFSLKATGPQKWPEKIFLVYEDNNATPTQGDPSWEIRIFLNPSPVGQPDGEFIEINVDEHIKKCYKINGTIVCG